MPWILYVATSLSEIGDGGGLGRIRNSRPAMTPAGCKCGSAAVLCIIPYFCSCERSETGKASVRAEIHIELWSNTERWKGGDVGGRPAARGGFLLRH